MAKGNEGPRLVPEIAALVNVQRFVVSVSLAPVLWEAAGCVAWFFNVRIRTGFGRSRIHSWSMLQKGGTWLTDKGLYHRRTFV